MSKPIYDFNGYKEFSWQEVYDKIAKYIDEACFSKIEAAAYQVTHLDVVSEIKAVIEEFNKPDYFLIANVKNTEALEEAKKQFEELKIKILYSPLVNEKTFYLIKRDAIVSEINYQANPLQFPEYNFRVDYPEHITKVVVD